MRKVNSRVGRNVERGDDRLGQTASISPTLSSKFSKRIVEVCHEKKIRADS